MKSTTKCSFENFQIVFKEIQVMHLENNNIISGFR